MAPSDPSGTVLEVCLRVRQSGAIRVLVALVRMILDLWAAPPRCGYWRSLGFFCSAPQDFGMLGVFYARFPPREASYVSNPSSNSYRLDYLWLKCNIDLTSRRRIRIENYNFCCFYSVPGSYEPEPCARFRLSGFCV